VAEGRKAESFCRQIGRIGYRLAEFTKWVPNAADFELSRLVLRKIKNVLK
jgi:hypothetical protein